MRLALALAAAAALASPAAAEPMPSGQVAALTAGNAFEFRGFARTRSGFENHVWRFAPDGRVTSESAMARLALGAMSDQFGLRAAGTWRRQGDQLCLQWEPGARRFDGCYTVLKGRGRMVHLVGPQFFEGTLEPSGPAAGTAEQRPAGPRPFGR
ncbi:MAG TPA: hypothetical protein VIF14_18825 [Alphaproteobacteria bacterium]|jgi:hypothetical protein